MLPHETHSASPPPGGAGSRDVTAAMGAIWAKRREGVLADLAIVEGAVAAALGGTLDEEGRNRARRAAHKIAGCAGTFGFPTASDRARGLELAFEAAGGPPMEELPRLADLVLALRCELEGPRSAAVAPAARAESERPADVLIVTPDAMRAHALRAEAERRQLRTSAVTDVAEARSFLESQAARLVVLDLAVDERPAAALAFLAEQAAERPVVVLSDPERRVDPVDIARHGGRGFLSHDTPASQVVDFVTGLHERLRGEGTTVLAVDDDPAVLNAVEAVVSAHGLEVHTCDDPRELWTALERVNPDLVVLDVEMPHATGLELCRAIRNDQRWTGLPVVFLAARDDPESIQAMFESGGDDFVPKPFVGPELLARIANRLERVRLYRSLAHNDGLTGLVNRRHGAEAIERLCRMAGRLGQPLALALLDVDRFKAINDRHGHSTGDLALRGVAAALVQTFRGEDVVCRWGGDEFVVAMYGMTSEVARERLGRLLEDLRALSFGPAGATVGVALTAGIAEFPRDGVTLDELYRAADHAMYTAKAAGGDRVHVSGDEPTAGTSVDVVLVEDDPVLGELLEHAFATRGYRTRLIADGAEALDVVRTAAPRLVLLDWDLPGLDGPGVLRSLAPELALGRMRVIMLTARATEREVVQALEAGAVDHVAKPFSVPVLMQRVRRAMER